MKHLDDEEALALEEAAAWNATETVAHVSACDACRSTLLDLEVLGALRATVAPDASFGTRMSVSIRKAKAAEPTEATARANARRVFSSGMPAAVFVAASMCAWCALLIISRADAASSARPLDFTASAFLAAIAGLAAAWHLTRIPTTRSHS